MSRVQEVLLNASAILPRSGDPEGVAKSQDESGNNSGIITRPDALRIFRLHLVRGVTSTPAALICHGHDLPHRLKRGYLDVVTPELHRDVCDEPGSLFRNERKRSVKEAVGDETPRRRRAYSVKKRHRTVSPSLEFGKAAVLSPMGQRTWPDSMQK